MSLAIIPRPANPTSHFLPLFRTLTGTAMCLIIITPAAQPRRHTASVMAMT
jgi:hypothetical protein